MPPIRPHSELAPTAVLLVLWVQIWSSWQFLHFLPYLSGKHFCCVDKDYCKAENVYSSIEQPYFSWKHFCCVEEDH